MSRVPQIYFSHNPPPQTFNRGLCSLQWEMWGRSEERKLLRLAPCWNCPHCSLAHFCETTSVSFLFFLVSQVQANQTIITCRLKRGGKNIAAGKTTKRTMLPGHVATLRKVFFFLESRTMFPSFCTVNKWQPITMVLYLLQQQQPAYPPFLIMFSVWAVAEL